MQNDILGSLNRLSDDELVARVKSLVSRERDVTVEIVAHLAELDTRDVHLQEGYPTLFVYCRDALGLSEWEAYIRIDVARAARRFPIILQMLADGSLHLTAVRLLARHLTPSNHVAVLQSARGRTKFEVEEIVAALAPRPDAPSSVRRLPTSGSDHINATDGVALNRVTASNGGTGAGSTIPTPSPAPDVVAPRPASDGASPRSGAHSQALVTPLSPHRYKLQLTIGGDTLERLRLAKDMLGHAIPSGDEAEVVDRALRVLVLELTKKKFGDVRAPRSSRPRPRAQNEDSAVRVPARNPPVTVKRAVWVRDLGRCAFVGTGGHRCGERRFVEFHHVGPYALGGETTVDGIQLRCRRHNDYEGRLYFGTRRRGRELVPEQAGLSGPLNPLVAASSREPPVRK